MYSPRIKDRQTALRAYRKLINLYWKDEIKDVKTRTLARLLDGYLKGEASYKLDGIEEQLNKLEKKMAGITL